jgi:hypothetical protein
MYVFFLQRIDLSINFFFVLSVPIQQPEASHVRSSSRAERATARPAVREQQPMLVLLEICPIANWI